MRLLINAQQGHGFGSYSDAGVVLHYLDSLQFFRDVSTNTPVETYTEWSFVQRDCSFDPPLAPGTRLRTPGFRYDPRQAQLAAGATPAEVVDALGPPQQSCAP